jgi:hypothetical protein
MSPEQQNEIARKAIVARWAKAKTVKKMSKPRFSGAGGLGEVGAEVLLASAENSANQSSSY